jgi:hypothetical protein
MKSIFTKTLLACSTAACLLASSAASAGIFNPFTVKPTGNPSGTQRTAPFVADKITGNYVEVATFKPDGTFAVSLFWNAGQFVTNGGTAGIGSNVTGLGFDYNMYAVYKAPGTYTPGVKTAFQFDGSGGSLQVYLDKGANTDLINFTKPATGAGSFAFAGSGDDIVLANGLPVSGYGLLDPTLPTCGAAGINCGSFGSTTTFSLTADGKNFFVAPNPFYDLSFQSGQLNNFAPSGTQTINGSLDVSFGRVPEPASIGLLGLGLLGLGLTRRRRNQA